MMETNNYTKNGQFDYTSDIQQGGKSFLPKINFRNKKKTISGLIIILVLGIGIAMGISQIGKEQDVRMKASASDVDLSMIPASQNVVPGEQFSVQINVNTHDHAINIAQIELIFDDNKFDFVSLVLGNALDVLIMEGYSLNNRGFITLGARPVSTGSDPTPTYEVNSFQGVGNLATLTLTVKTNADLGTSQISFQTDRNDATGTIVLTGNTGDTNVVGDLSGTSITIDSDANSPSPTSIDTKPPNKKTCTSDNDCGCALDVDTNDCAIQNITYLTGHCTWPDFCSGISGNCGPKCVDNLCQFDCPRISPTITPSTNPTCIIKPGDFNQNCSVDIFDYNVLVECFGQSGASGFHPADIIQNGVIDIFDYNAIVENFG
ncbi:cohesin domain-containing protein [Patescibacteria group bacterium]